METGTPFSDRGSPRLGYSSFFTTQNSRDFRICAGVSKKVDWFAPAASLAVMTVAKFFDNNYVPLTLTGPILCADFRLSPIMFSRPYERGGEGVRPFNPGLTILNPFSVQFLQSE